MIFRNMKNYFISETHVSEIIHVILAIVFVYVRLVKARDVSITKTRLYSQDDIFSRRVCSVTDIQADSKSSRKYFVHLKQGIKLATDPRSPGRGHELASSNTGSPSRVLLKLCIRINTYEIYSSVLKPAICGLRAG